MKQLKNLYFLFFLFFLVAILQAQVPNVPYFYQYNNSINPGGSCQNTSIAMLLKYYGATNITPDAISSVHGTSAAQTVSGFNSVCNTEAQYYGLTGSCVSTSSGSFSAMNSLLAQGRPVVVHGYFTTYGHVLVVLAFTGTHYICNDPAGQWNQQYQGSYSGGSTSGHQIQYGVTAFQNAIGPDNTLWYHYFNGTPLGAPTNLTATQSPCPQNNVTFSWNNSGSSWHIDVSTTSNFSSYWWKYVSGLTSYTGPAGFVDHVDGVTPLVFQSGTTYYWRITHSGGTVSGTPFTIHFCDTTPPTTSIALPSLWLNQNFNIIFSDVDNNGGSGVEKGFYQVTDYDGSEWGANPNMGYISDDFNLLNTALWATPTGSGTWNVSNGNLVQSDELLSNTNIYTTLTQNLSNRYVYHFNAKAGGTGSDRRFGFHYFCDDATLSNRGNSYFVWFRLDGQTLEFYKVVNNSFTAAQKIVSNITTTPNQWYDFKIVYDRVTGRHDVYRNNILLGTWIDTSPLSNGNAVSLRTGNCQLSVSDINVYRSRAATKNITVGSSLSDIRYQNANPTIPAAKIKSLVVDSAFNLSAIVTSNVNVDWTLPDCVVVNDGIGADEDTIISNTAISANWTASSDMHSGIYAYSYALGTMPGSTDIIDWIYNGLSTQTTISGLNLNHGQMYYFSVKTENNAGMSCISTSDGAYIDMLSGTENLNNEQFLYVNQSGKSLHIFFKEPFNDKLIMEVFNVIGKLVFKEDLMQQHTSLNISEWNSGVYLLVFKSSGQHFSKKILIY